MIASFNENKTDKSINTQCPETNINMYIFSLLINVKNTFENIQLNI